MKNQEKKEKKIDDKDKFEPPPYSWLTWCWSPNASTQYSGSTDSYLPYALINHN